MKRCRLKRYKFQIIKQWKSIITTLLTITDTVMIL